MQVDNEQLNLGSEDIENIDDSRLSRFIEINSLHFVTEYNPAVNNSPKVPVCVCRGGARGGAGRVEVERGMDLST